MGTEFFDKFSQCMESVPPASIKTCLSASNMLESFAEPFSTGMETMLKILRLNPLKLGYFLTLGTSFAVILSANHAMPAVDLRPGVLDPGLLVSLGLSCVAFLFFFDGRKAQWLMGFGLVCATGVSLYTLKAMPSRSFIVLCLLLLSAYLLPRIADNDRQHPADFRQNMLKSMVWMTLFNWALVHVFRITAGTTAQGCLIFSAWLCVMFSVIDRYFSGGLRQIGLVWSLLSLLTISFLPTLLQGPYLMEASRLSILGPIVCLPNFRFRNGLRRRITAMVEGLFFHPEGVVLIFFLAFCALGTLLLSLPLRNVEAGGIALIDAAFTAVSAVCVTGLSVLDTAKDFSRWDQFIILILIQVGGLGIMTLSSLAIFLMGQRMSLTQEATLYGVIGQKKLKNEMRHTLARVLIFTFVVEALGAMILTWAFSSTAQTWYEALWKGVFTAISAFCNAGFALESNNLMPWQNSPVVLHTVATLIIIGGLSPAFVMALPRLGRDGPVPLQFKLILIANVVLLFGGAFLLLGLEWNGSLQTLSLSDKIHNAWFQSVTTRTAGFNSIDMASLDKPAIYIMMVLMVIGGSPGGTAGGIKTTTFMVLVFTAINIIRGRQEVLIFGRHLRHSTVYKALTATLLALATGLCGFLLLAATQTIETEKMLFEVISALGTVGLSLGVTANFDAFGKFILMMCMFLGRVGPLSVLIFMLEQPVRTRWTLPSEDVSVA
jgi:trk system potassium uptake protein